MSRAQAEQFLDAQKDEIRAMIFLPSEQTNHMDDDRPVNDW
jgi:hypothetical protein